jgi:hypothetical protein
MPDDEKLTPADPDDLAAALAFALKFEGAKRWHDADAFMADIAAKRLVSDPCFAASRASRYDPLREQTRQAILTTANGKNARQTRSSMPDCSAHGDPARNGCLRIRDQLQALLP